MIEKEWMIGRQSANHSPSRIGLAEQPSCRAQLALSMGKTPRCTDLTSTRKGEWALATDRPQS